MCMCVSGGRDTPEPQPPTLNNIRFSGAIKRHANGEAALPYHWHLCNLFKNDDSAQPENMCSFLNRSLEKLDNRGYFGEIELLVVASVMLFDFRCVRLNEYECRLSRIFLYKIINRC